ncbi:MAG TPA: hypothetical protein VG222_15345, partial [Vicinamibacterales bacterium]|nr:hypothetical protein [Vicinamibacterales bacterium]
MPQFRQRLVLGATVCAVLGLLGTRGHGQSADSPRARQGSDRGTIVDHVAPPAIERGISPLEAREPGSPEELRRLSLQPVAGPVNRIGRGGAAYVPGRVIVKFKDGASQATKSSAMSAVSRTARMSARPDYANFDIVTIDAGEDAEAAAQAFSARGDVEYAQAAYRVHTEFVPNDAFYPQQWNFPLIDMERAWDIQPQAGSTITVAVVDTGVAYTSATMPYHAGAFRVDSDGLTEPVSGSGTLYPALG